LVPISAPGRAWAAHSEELAASVESVLASGEFVGGREVAAFESEFAAHIGVEHVIGVGSGTSALELALRILGIGLGDEVATVTMTAAGTVAAIQHAGATPALTDVDPIRMTMCPRSLETLLETRSIKAIIPVHLYGNPADLPAIAALASNFGIPVIEDCAQAHGAGHSGRVCGTWGDVSAFSFYPTKNLGAIGDAGAVVTNDPQLAQRARMLREYGWRERHRSEFPGMNSRLDAIQAAVLRVKLRHLNVLGRRRQMIARRYSTRLEALSYLRLPTTAFGCVHAYHQYVVRCDDRDSLSRHMRAQGIQTSVLYPHPIHTQPAFREGLPQAPSGLANAERACQEVLSIPCIPELEDEEIERVIDALVSYGVRPGG
jgi:dTDP-4-amino-4,6-dideoxygalactose transaminase